MQIKAIEIPFHPSQNGYHKENKEQMLVLEGREGNSYIWLGRMEISPLAMEISIEGPQNLKIELLHNLTIPLLGTYWKE
jgi:hypothetical protein